MEWKTADSELGLKLIHSGETAMITNYYNCIEKVVTGIYIPKHIQIV